VYGVRGAGMVLIGERGGVVLTIGRQAEQAR
jgi:hypothetical protein